MNILGRSADLIMTANEFCRSTMLVTDRSAKESCLTQQINVKQAVQFYSLLNLLVLWVRNHEMKQQ